MSKETAPAPPSSVSRRRAGRAFGLLAAYVVVQVARLLAFIGSWMVVGRAITEGDLSGEPLVRGPC